VEVRVRKKQRNKYKVMKAEGKLLRRWERKKGRGMRVKRSTEGGI
jgi:hypothetical protein